MTRDSGRDCIKDVYISRNQLCSDLPKFPVHTDIGLCYRRPLPSPQNIGLGSLWDPISSTYVSDLGLILGALSSTLISNISRDTPGSSFQSLVPTSHADASKYSVLPNTNFTQPHLKQEELSISPAAHCRPCSLSTKTNQASIASKQTSKTREEPHGNGVGYTSPLCTPLPHQWGGEVLWLLEVGAEVD